MKKVTIYRQFIYGLMVIFGLFSGSSMAEDAFELKAAFTYNFAKFTQWPQARIEQQSTWKICFIGKQYRDSFMALSTKKIDSQSISPIELTETNQVDQCDAIFIDSNYRELTRRLFLAVHDKAILTVSDISGFSAQGGMIEIIEQDQRLYFKVNQQALEKAGLTISSQVLKLAVEVKR